MKLCYTITLVYIFFPSSIFNTIAPVNITMEIDVLFLIILLMKLCYIANLVYIFCLPSTFDTISS